MNLFLPILASVLQAGSFTFDKVILSIKHVTFKAYLGMSFPIGFFVTLIIFFIFKPPLSLDLFSGNAWLALLGAVALSIITNILYYRALKYDHLGELQAFDLLHNVPLILFSSILFTDERNFFVLIPAIVATIAVVWSHWSHHHLRIAKQTLPFVIWYVTIAPFAAPLSKILLETWNPISFELVRSGIISLILWQFLSRYALHIEKKAFRFLIISNTLSAISWILFYFSYQASGIVYTTLIFLLLPLLVYFSSVFILKEQFHWKKGVAFGIVLLSIAVAQVMG